MPRGFKIPAGVIGTVAGLVAGVGVGVIGMAAYGYQTQKDIGPVDAQGGPPPGFGAGGMPGGPPGGMGGPPGGMKGMGGGGKGKGKGFGPNGPNDKDRLTTLVTKLQQLTDKPLTLKLNDEQRTAIREQLKDLADQEELSNDDAKKRLDAILDAVKDNRATLEAAGFSWPGGAPQFPSPAANPFKEGEPRERLTVLQESLAKKK